MKDNPCFKKKWMCFRRVIPSNISEGRDWMLIDLRENKTHFWRKNKIKIKEMREIKEISKTIKEPFWERSQTHRFERSCKYEWMSLWRNTKNNKSDFSWTRSWNSQSNALLSLLFLKILKAWTSSKENGKENRFKQSFQTVQTTKYIDFIILKGVWVKNSLKAVVVIIEQIRVNTHRLRNFGMLSKIRPPNLPTWLPFATLHVLWKHI